MGAENIGLINLASLVVLLLPVLWINKRLGIKISNKLLIAIGRMVVQLGCVGLFLNYLFVADNWGYNILYLTLMIGVASFSAMRTCKLELKRFALPIFLGFVIPNLFILVYFNFFVVGISNIFHAQYLITIGGMLLGNSLSGNIITLNSFYNGIRENQNEYFYYLSLSGRKLEALMPYFKKALLSAINPTIASIETIGLVALPGMMTGQILGGSVPLTAIKYQMAIMVAILIARYFSSILTILLTVPKAFDAYDILILDNV